MRSTLRFARLTVLATALCAAQAHADVDIHVRILDRVGGFLGSFADSFKSDPRVVGDTLTRDDQFSQSTSFASADLGTGELKVNATGFPRMPYTNAFIAQATASMSDVLTIVGPGSSPINVTLTMLVDGVHGTPESSAGEGRAFSFVRGTISVDASSESAELLRTTRYDAGGVAVENILSGVRDWVGAAPLPGTDDRFELLLSFETQITPNVPFTFGSEIFASVSYLPPNPTVALLGTPIVSDFGNTAVINVVLPEDYSLSSQSGVFLAGPIPEPGTWAMMLAGLGCLAAGARRRQRGTSLARA